MMVVAHHMGQLFVPNFGFNFVGASGVDVFFVISGFMMVYSTDLKPQTARYFLANRIIRVVPLYWAITIAMWAAIIMLPALFSPDRVHSLNELLLSLFFLPFERFDGTIQPILIVGWTLNYEMFFYALFALGIWLFGSRKALTVPVISFVLVVLVCLGLAMPDIPATVGFYLRPVLLEFVFGMGLAVVHRRIVWPRIHGAIPLLIGAASFAALLYLEALDVDVSRGIWAGVPATVLVGACLWLEKTGIRWTFAPLQILGAASYSLYLLHLFPIQFGEKLVTPDTSFAESVAIAVASLCAALMGAVAAYYLFERPVTRFLRRSIEHPARRVVRAADR